MTPKYEVQTRVWAGRKKTPDTVIVRLHDPTLLPLLRQVVQELALGEPLIFRRGNDYNEYAVDCPEIAPTVAQYIGWRLTELTEAENQ